MNLISDNGRRAADRVIAALTQDGKGDYSQHRDNIALDVYENGLWEGNWDSSFDPADYDEASTLPAIRVIQEDEYDQSMSDDDKPDWDDMIAQVDSGYLFLA